MGNDRLCKMDESKKRKGGGMRRGIRRHVCRETNFGWFRIFSNKVFFSYSSRVNNIRELYSYVRSSWSGHAAPTPCLSRMERNRETRRLIAADWTDQLKIEPISKSV